MFAAASASLAEIRFDCVAKRDETRGKDVSIDENFSFTFSRCHAGRHGNILCGIDIRSSGSTVESRKKNWRRENVRIRGEFSRFDKRTGKLSFQNEIVVPVSTRGGLFFAMRLFVVLFIFLNGRETSVESRFSWTRKKTSPVRRTSRNSEKSKIRKILRC